MRKILLASVGESTGDDAVRTLLPLIAVSALGLGGGLLGLLNALPFLWYLTAHRLIGVTVDSLGHRRAVLLGNGLRLATVSALILLLLTGLLSTPALLGLAALLGLGDALFTTGHSAMVPAVVGRERTATCYQRIEAVSAVARVTSPATVSALLRLASPAVALALGLFSYLLSLLALASLPRNPEPEPADSPPDEAAGPPPPSPAPQWTVRRVLTTPGLGRLTLATTLLNAAAMISGTAMVLFALETLGLTTSTVALLTAAAASGSLLGAVGSGKLRSQLPTGAAKLLATAGVALASLIAPAALLLPAPAIVLGLGEALVAACATASAVVGSDVPALLIPQHELGRAFATIRLLTIGVMPAASVLGGLWIEATSPVAALIGAAGVAALACLPMVRIRHWSPLPQKEHP